MLVIYFSFEPKKVLWILTKFDNIHIEDVACRHIFLFGSVENCRSTIKLYACEFFPFYCQFWHVIIAFYNYNNSNTPGPGNFFNFNIESGLPLCYGDA